MDKKIMVLALASMSFNSIAAAGTYVKIEGGYSQATKFRNYNKSEELKEDLVGGSSADVNYKSSKSGIMGVALGYRFNPIFRADLSLHHMHHKFSGRHYSTTSKNHEEAIIEESFTSKKSIKVNTTSILLNGYRDFPNATKFTPYISAGIGVAVHKSKDFKENNQHNTITSIEGIEDADNNKWDQSVKGRYKTSLAWSIGIGSQIQASERVSFDIGVRYFDFGKTATKNKWLIDGVKSDSHGAIGTRLKGVIGTVGLTYKF